MSNTTIVKGNMGKPAELRFTQSGKAVLGFSLADTPRRRNANGEWEDAGETLWLDVTVWGDEAEVLADQMGSYKGRVTVTGRLGIRSYETRDGGQRQSVTLTADSVAMHPKAPTPQQSSGWGSQDAQKPRERPRPAQYVQDHPQAVKEPQGAAQGAQDGNWSQRFNDEPPF